jgi:hypothetical protein
MAQMASHGYDPLMPVPEDAASEALDVLCGWYEESCALRFISSIRTVTGDPNKGFVDLIAQFEEDTANDSNDEEN